MWFSVVFDSTAHLIVQIRAIGLHQIDWVVKWFGHGFVSNQSIGERDSFLTRHNFLFSSKLRSSEFRVVSLRFRFFFIYFNSYGLFSHQLIVCRYDTVVDFYVPIQFYSFFCVQLLASGCTNRMRFYYFSRARSHSSSFFQSGETISTKAFFFVAFCSFFPHFIAARMTSISRYTSSLEVVKIINCIDANACARTARVWCMQNSFKIQFDT